MKRLATVILVYDDGSLTIQDTDRLTAITTQGPLAEIAVEVTKRRRSKRRCQICGEKFFGPGIGSHMKACRKAYDEPTEQAI